MLSRRNFVLAGTAGALSFGFAPRLAFAQAATDKRFVFIIQRGAADGLATVAPVGDPAFAAQRGCGRRSSREYAKRSARPPRPGASPHRARLLMSAWTPRAAVSGHLSRWPHSRSLPATARTSRL